LKLLCFYEFFGLTPQKTRHFMTRLNETDRNTVL
jgi:hypothetical protein